MASCQGHLDNINLNNLLFHPSLLPFVRLKLREV